MSFWQHYQDNAYFTANATFNGKGTGKLRFAIGAAGAGFTATAGAGLGAIVGGISEDGTAGGGALKGAAIFGGLSVASSGFAAGYGKYLGRNGYTMKTSKFTDAGIPQGTVFEKGTGPRF